LTSFPVEADSSVTELPFALATQTCLPSDAIPFGFLNLSPGRPRTDVSLSPHRRSAIDLPPSFEQAQPVAVLPRRSCDLVLDFALLGAWDQIVVGLIRDERAREGRTDSRHGGS
jgi:hypothetical protein